MSIVKWISVNDKLPEPGKRVIATNGAFVGEFFLTQGGEWKRYNELDRWETISRWMYFPDA